MAENQVKNERAICNYEGTSYRADFWEGQGRDFEDLAERIAIRRLLPPNGYRVVDIGAGFGRLVDLYEGYEKVVLLDYATSGLREAQARLGLSKRFTYVAANIYHLPLAPGTCDTAVTVRVLHHLSDVPAALRAIASALRPGGAYLVEYANKRNLKAMMRYWFHRQAWSPFTAEPYEFTELNFDFHPKWMARALAHAGFQVDAELAVSHFRYPALKRAVPAATLARIDGWLQRPGARLKLAPSVFLHAHTAGHAPAHRQALFACPTCGGQEFNEAPTELACRACGARWAITEGIYDFRQPL